MADSKLKLQIVTALDAAGIKATKEQIDKMESSLSKFNKNGSSGLTSLEKKLGTIPGPAGKIADIFEGLGGKVAKFGGIATSVIGAFKIGWDIGTFLNDKVIKPLFKIKDPIEELKKSNQRATKELEKFVQTADDASEHTNTSVEKTKAALASEIQIIDQTASAWQKAARSRIAYMTAGQDVETQMLERQRFEDVMRLQAEGDYEGAEQANKIYDVLKAQIEAKHELAKFDAETLTIRKQIKDNDEKQYKLYESFSAAQDARMQKEKEYAKFEKDTDEIVMDDKTYRWYQRKASRYQQEIGSLKLAEEQAWSTYQNFDNGSDQLKTREIQRMALASRTSLAVDQAALAYDQFNAANGNVLGYEFTQQFKDTLTQTSIESYNNIEKAIKQGVAEGIGLLMAVK